MQGRTTAAAIFRAPFWFAMALTQLETSVLAALSAQLLDVIGAMPTGTESAPQHSTVQRSTVLYSAVQYCTSTADCVVQPLHLRQVLHAVGCTTCSRVCRTPLIHDA